MFILLARGSLVAIIGGGADYEALIPTAPSSTFVAKFLNSLYQFDETHFSSGDHLNSSYSGCWVLSWQRMGSGN